MKELKKSVFDNRQDIMNKNSRIDNLITVERDSIIDREIHFINTVIRNIGFTLPRETFSCRHGFHIYTFKHEPGRDTYISPEVYLIEDDTVVYEVLQPKKYYEVTTNEILISKDGTYYCEIPLVQFLKYVCIEDIVDFIEEKINMDYNELISLKDRTDFLDKLGY